MNATQRNYAAARMKSLLAERLTALQKDYAVPAKTITDEARFRILADVQTLYFKDGINEIITPYTRVVDVFDFSAYERPAGYRKGYDEAEKALRADARRVEDRIMLGDSEAALALLDAFATGTTALP